MSLVKEREREHKKQRDSDNKNTKFAITSFKNKPLQQSKGARKGKR